MDGIIINKDDYINFYKEDKKLKDGVADLDYYCNDDYVDCDELTINECSQNMIDNKFMDFNISIQKSRGVYERYKLSFRYDWLFFAIREIGYGCLKDFENCHGESDMKELYLLTNNDPQIFKMEYIETIEYC